MTRKYFHSPPSTVTSSVKEVQSIGFMPVNLIQRSLHNFQMGEWRFCRKWIMKNYYSPLKVAINFWNTPPFSVAWLGNFPGEGGKTFQGGQEFQSLRFSVQRKLFKLIATSGNLCFFIAMIEPGGVIGPPPSPHPLLRHWPFSNVSQFSNLLFHFFLLFSF